MDARVPTDAPAKAYSYVRFSTPQQQEGASFQRQMEKANKFALEHGLILDTELNMSDLGVSAYRGKNARTGALAGFLEAVHKGRVEAGSYVRAKRSARFATPSVCSKRLCRRRFNCFPLGWIK
jgi:DNA invertase Pin-like site-specific DNA recombinase